MKRNSKKSAPVVAEVAAVVTPAEEVLGSDDLRPDDLQDAVKTSPANAAPEAPESAPTLDDLLCAPVEDESSTPEPSFVAELPAEELPHPELDVVTALDTSTGSMISFLVTDPPSPAEQLENLKTAIDTPNLFADEPARLVPSPFDSNGEPVELGPPPVGIKPPSPRGSDFVPTVGSWWKMESIEPFALTVVGHAVDGSVLCHDYVKAGKNGDGVVAGTVFKGVESVPLEDFRTGILTEIHACPQWLLDARDELRPAPEVARDTLEEESADWSREVSAPAPLLGVHEVAAELGIDAQQVTLLVDSALGAAARLLTFKSVLSTSPVIERILQLIQSPRAIEGISAMVSQVLPQVGETRFRELDEKIDELVRRVDGVVTLVGSQDSLIDALSALSKKTAESFTSFEHSVSLVLEAHRAKLEELNARADSVRQGFRDIAKTNAVLSSPVSESQALEELKRELIAVINQQLNPLREEMAILSDRQDDVERKRLVVEQQKKKDQRRRFDAMKVPKSEQLEVRRARDKTAREQKKRLAPSTLGMTAPPTGEKRGRGRPKGSTNVKKPAKLVAIEKAQKEKKAPKPAAVFVDFVAQIMGDRTDAKIKKLLGRVAPHNLPKFSGQVKRGVPDLPKLTDWNEAERWAFTQWFYSGRAN